MEIKWIKPKFETEYGEFERVSAEFFIPLNQLRLIYNKAKITKLNRKKIYNCNVNDPIVSILGVYEMFRANDCYRNIEGIISGFIKGKMEAPIILKKGKKYHCVSGNTRLVLAKIFKITINVVLMKYEKLLLG